MERRGIYLFIYLFLATNPFPSRYMSHTGDIQRSMQPSEPGRPNGLTILKMCENLIRGLEIETSIAGHIGCIRYCAGRYFNHWFHPARLWTTIRAEHWKHNRFQYGEEKVLTKLFRSNSESRGREAQGIKKWSNKLTITNEDGTVMWSDVPFLARMDNVFVAMKVIKFFKSTSNYSKLNPVNLNSSTDVSISVKIA